MGTITKRNDKFRAQICINGMRESRSFHLKSEATAWMRSRETYLSELKTGKTARITLAALVEEWNTRYAAVRTDGHRDYKRLKAITDNWFGSVSLVDLDAGVIAKWRDERLTTPSRCTGKPVLGSTINRDWNMLSGMCQLAVDEMKLMESNPFKEASRPDDPDPRTKLCTQEEIDLLYATAKGVKSVTVIVMFELASETGMSGGEVCDLMWEWIDLQKRIITLPKFKTRPTRKVPLSKKAIEILGEKGTGSVYNMKKASRDALFRKVREKAGIEDLTFHDARALAATKLSKRLNPLQLAKVLGHRSSAMLDRVYFRENVEEMVALLD